MLNKAEIDTSTSLDPSFTQVNNIDVSQDVILLKKSESIGSTAENPPEAELLLNDSSNVQSAKPSSLFPHILQRDTFLVFRSLCKLSMKQLPETPLDPRLVFKFFLKTNLKKITTSYLSLLNS